MSVGYISIEGSDPRNRSRMLDVVLRNIRHRLVVYRLTNHDQNPECIFLSNSLRQLLEEGCLELQYNWSPGGAARTLFGIHVETYVPKNREDALEFYFSDDCFRFTEY